MGDAEEQIVHVEGRLRSLLEEARAVGQAAGRVAYADPQPRQPSTKPDLTEHLLSLLRDSVLATSAPPDIELTASTGLLLGREREIAELRLGLDRALGGRGGLLMVAGDAGVGKTALADELGSEAVEAGALVLWGRAWAGGGAPAYWPWLRILRRLAAERDVRAAIAALGPEAGALLSRLMPDVVPPPARGPTAADPAPGESDAARFQLFDAVTSLLRAAASSGPIVLILDDLHGADQPSLLLLGFLAVHLRDSPILVIGTYRETEARLDPQLAGTLGDIMRHGQRLPLRGLRERDVGAVVERVAGRRPPDRVVRAIHQATEGNPFFVDEVVRLLSAEGRLESEAQVASLRIPDGVRETIRHRLAPLPDRARVLLLTASVIGPEFRLDTLQRVCDLQPAELDGALSEAVDCGVIVERPTRIGVYGFSHGLIREALYDDLGPQRRGVLHRSVGLALEELYAADAEPHVAELAHHFFVAATAGELAKAIDYSVRAGRRAMSLVAYEEALDHFERALQAYGLQERADVLGRCDLLLALGTAQSRAGSARSARETFLRAAGLARKVESSERLAHAALGYGAGMGGFEFGLVDDALIDLLVEAREALGPADGSLLARVLGRTATELYHSDRAQERDQLSQEAVAMGRRIGDRATIATTLSARFLTCQGRRTPSSACRSRPTSSRLARRRATATSCCTATRGGCGRSWSSETGSAPTSSSRSTPGSLTSCATRCTSGKSRCTRRTGRCSKAAWQMPSVWPPRRSRRVAGCRHRTRCSCMRCSFSRCGRYRAG